MAQHLLGNRAPGPFDDAWQQCKRNFADLPEHVTVTQGESLCVQPVFVERLDQRRVLQASTAVRDDPLMHALLNADYNRILTSLQPHDPCPTHPRGTASDPLSWHCASRFPQQQWFVYQPTWGCYGGDTPTPMHACVLAGTPVKRPLWDDKPPLLAEELESSLFSVHLDVLADRQVALHATPAPGILDAPSKGPENRIPFHRRVVSAVRMPRTRHRLMPDDSEETTRGPPHDGLFFSPLLPGRQGGPGPIRALRPFQRDSDSKDMTVKRRKCTRL